MINNHKFQPGNKLGGNKPKPYKTIRINKNVPEKIHAKVIADIEASILDYKKTLKKH